MKKMLYWKRACQIILLGEVASMVVTVLATDDMV